MNGKQKFSGLENKMLPIYFSKTEVRRRKFAIKGTIKGNYMYILHVSSRDILYTVCLSVQEVVTHSSKLLHKLVTTFLDI